MEDYKEKILTLFPEEKSPLEKLLQDMPIVAIDIAGIIVRDKPEYEKWKEVMPIPAM